METPTELQLDLLREVANIGCGHAAKALSRMVGGTQVQIQVPRVVVTAVSELAKLMSEPEGRVVSASLDMAGGLVGKVLLVLPVGDAGVVAEVLLGRTPAAANGSLGREQKEAFVELANILVSACLSAISDLTGLRLLPSVPSFYEGTPTEVLEQLSWPAMRDVVVGMEARFTTRKAPEVTGQLLLLPDEWSVRKLLSKLEG